MKYILIYHSNGDVNGGNDVYFNIYSTPEDCIKEFEAFWGGNVAFKEACDNEDISIYELGESVHVEFEMKIIKKSVPKILNKEKTNAARG